MTIFKSLLITIAIILSLTILGFSIILFNTQSIHYQEIITLFQIVPNLIIYSCVLVYFKKSQNNLLVTNNTIKLNSVNLGIVIILFAVGNQLCNLPFFDWKILANKYFGKSFLLPHYSNQNYTTSTLYRGLNLIIVSPFFEEYIFRYYIFGGLLKKYNVLTSVIISSILFSFIHIFTPRNLIPTFIFGISSAMIYFNTKRIKFSILLHVLYNVLWLITFVYGEEYEKLKNYIGFGSGYWLLFLTGIIVFLLALGKITNNKFGLNHMWTRKSQK